ncbi:MAG: hypothetical protein RR510_13390 [Morganella sp. (in: enterobacteria)]
MNISHDYTETGPFISDGDVDKKASHILNMMNKKKNKNNDKDVVVTFNSNVALYNDCYRGGSLCGSPPKRIKKNDGIIINHIHDIYSRSDKIRVFTLSGNDTNAEVSEIYNIVTTDESARSISGNRGVDLFQGDVIKNKDILSVRRGITKDNALMVQPEEMINITSDNEICGYGKKNIILTETITEGVPVEASVPSELPVFLHHATESSETKNPLPNIVLNQRENGEQGKMLFLSADTGKYPVSQENNRADYYFFYYFRQKYQSSEPVYIYRDQSGRFKLDTHSELVRRKLKLSMDVNTVGNIDIL